MASLIRRYGDRRHNGNPMLHEQVVQHATVVLPAEKDQAVFPLVMEQHKPHGRRRYTMEHILGVLAK